MRRCLTMDLCISANRLALSALRSSRFLRHDDDAPSPANAVVPKRVVIPQREVQVRVRSSSPQSQCTNDNNPLGSQLGGHPLESMSVSRNQSSKSVAAPDMTLFKPAAYYPSITTTDSTDETETVDKVLMGMKTISVRSKNPSRGKPSGPATVTLLDVETGEITSVVSATYLTAARTAAGSAIATHICLGLGEFQTETFQTHNLSDSTRTLNNNLHLLIVGAGLQAELHALAMRHVLGDALTKMTILNRTWDRANRLKERLLSLKENSRESENVYNDNANQDDRKLMKNVEIDVLTFDGRHGDEISVSSSSQSTSSTQHKLLQETIHRANVICTATNTTTPLINWDWVQDGCHINGVGSYLSTAEEVDKDFIANRCITICDTKEAFDVGDLKYVQENSENFVGLLGDLLSSKEEDKDGSVWAKIRNKDKEKCTFFKSVGTAIQDIVTANSVVETAQRLGIGTNIDMS